MNLIKYNQLIMNVIKALAYYSIIFILSAITIYKYPIFAVAVLASAYSSRRPLLPVLVVSFTSLGLFKFESMGVLSAFFALFMLLTTVIKPLNAIENREEQRKVGNYLMFILIFMNLPFFTLFVSISLAMLTYASYKIFVNGFAILVNLKEKLVFSKQEITSFYIVLLLVINIILGLFIKESGTYIYSYLLLIPIIAIASYKDGLINGLIALLITIISSYLYIGSELNLAYLIITWLAFSELGLVKKQWVILGVIIINILAILTQPIVQTAVLIVSVYIIIFTRLKEEVQPNYIIENALPVYRENRVEGSEVSLNYINKAKEDEKSLNTINKMKKITQGLTEKLNKSFPKIKEKLTSILMFNSNNNKEELRLNTDDITVSEENKKVKQGFEEKTKAEEKNSEPIVVKSKEQIFKELEEERKKLEKIKKEKELKKEINYEVDLAVSDLLNRLPNLTLEVFESYDEKNKFMKDFLKNSKIKTELRLFEELVYRDDTIDDIYTEYVRDIYVNLTNERLYDILLSNDIVIIDSKDETFIKDLKIINEFLEEYMKQNEHRIREKVVSQIKLDALEKVKKKIFKDQAEEIEPEDDVYKEELEIENSIKKRLNKTMKKVKRVSIKKLAKEIKKKNENADTDTDK